MEQKKQKKQNNHGGKRIGAGRKSSTHEPNDYITVVVKRSKIRSLGGKKIVKARLESVADKME